FRATACACYSVQVNRVDMRGLCSIRQIDGNGITHAYTNEWTRHLVVERPVFIGGTVGQLPHDFCGFQINRYMLWTTLANRRTNLGGIHDNIQCSAFDLSLWLAHNQFTHHTCSLMARQCAQVFESTVFIGTEYD